MQKKCIKNGKLSNLFQENEKKSVETRQNEKFKVNHANTQRMQKSAVIHMQNLLNEDHKQNKTKEIRT